MSSISDYDAEIADVHCGRPHVVILGAGASLAAFPNGDKYGKKLPLMKDLVDVVGLAPILDEAKIKHRGVDFEALYSELATNGNYETCLQKIESALFEYFSQLELPEAPTLYDHLVLSLRDKDVIATFNWDPFLCQALTCNYKQEPMPQALFLHGNVAAGYCMAHSPGYLGRLGEICQTCGKPLKKSRLLYPVAKKDYNVDSFISRNWEILQHALEKAYMLTIFGYSAPRTDAAAIDLLSRSWGPSYQRNLEEIEIIDIM